MQDDVIVVPLKFCEWDKARKRLMLASEFFGGGFPRSFVVRSHHTQREITFASVPEDDILFDPDQWDGEQMIYRASVPLPNVDHIVVYHQY